MHARLRRGRLFKFQVQGAAFPDAAPDDTWLGATLSEQDARDIAVRCGFEMRHQYGAGSQYFWLWFFKRQFLADWWYRGKYALLVAYQRGRGKVSRALHKR